MLTLAKQGTGFVFFKSIVFFSVILYSYLGYSAEYVQIEQSIALASILAPFFVLGLTTSYSHYNLNLNDASLNRVYWLHMNIIVLLLVTLGFISAFFLKSFQLPLFFLVLFVFSRFFAQKFKITNSVLVASFYDSIPYLYVAASLIVLAVLRDLSTSTSILFYLLVVAYFYLLLKSFNIKIDDGFSELKIEKVKEFYFFGIKTFIVSAIVVGVVMTPRVLAHLVVDPAEIEPFLLSLRFSSVAVLVYQFFSIRYFSAIYKLNLKWVLSIVGVGGVFSFAIIFIWLLFLGAVGVIQLGKSGALVSFFTSVWIVSSFLEYFVVREGGGNVFTGVSFFFLAAILIAIYIWGGDNYSLFIVGGFICLLFAQVTAICFGKASRAS